MSPPRPPPNPAALSPFTSPPPEFCLPLAPTTEVLPLFAPDHLSAIQGEVAPSPPAVDNPAFQCLFVPAPPLSSPIEAEQFLHFLAQTEIRVFMHRAFHEYLERAVRILNPDLTLLQVHVLAQGYREGRVYPTPHCSQSANPWESVHLLPQNWIDPRAGWPDDTVGWNSWDRSFNIRCFLVPLDMYVEHGEWEPEVEYKEGAIASANFLEGEELRDLALELDEDASFVYGLPDPNPAAPLPSPAASSEDEESNP
ncbi:hypothetical protein B0H17DRAFT_1199322 [Mycena rosella]|uniref:Uncharacterized protein n=1 Tax=Mycena rosella TaxID=1033263 RepID=A0AAD7GGP3_MYCRO|nr:hypothetical protein B0H17DRAFT_1199322 [Mycena rosella]